MKRPVGLIVVVALMFLGAGLLALGSLAFFVLGAVAVTAGPGGPMSQLFLDVEISLLGSARRHRFCSRRPATRINRDSSVVASSEHYGARLAAFCDCSRCLDLVVPGQAACSRPVRRAPESATRGEAKEGNTGRRSFSSMVRELRSSDESAVMLRSTVLTVQIGPVSASHSNM